MMQKLSVQLSDARNKGEFGDPALGGFSPPSQPWQTRYILCLSEGTCTHTVPVPIFSETPRQPEKLKEETRSPAATGNTQDEVLVEEGTREGPWGGEGRWAASC